MVTVRHRVARNPAGRWRMLPQMGKQMCTCCYLLIVVVVVIGFGLERLGLALLLAISFASQPTIEYQSGNTRWVADTSEHTCTLVCVGVHVRVTNT